MASGEFADAPAAVRSSDHGGMLVKRITADVLQPAVLFQALYGLKNIGYQTEVFLPC